MIETCSLRKGDNPLMCHIGESPERRFKVFYRLAAQSIMSSNLLGIKTRQWGLRVSTSEPIHSAVRRNVSLRERAYRRWAGQPHSNRNRASPDNVA